jgi:Ca-activated chloride channel family protein
LRAAFARRVAQPKDLGANFTPALSDGMLAMKFTKFSKYTGEPADAIDLEELVKKLGDFFLQSGFESQFYGMDEFDPERSMDALREAILRALQEGDLFDENSLTEKMRQMLQRSDAMNNEEIRDLIDKLMERMAQEGFINPQQPPQITPPNQATARGSVGPPMDRNQSQVRFEITDKTIDFLGFKTLQDLLGSLGRSSFGRHDTRDLSTGIESGGVSRAYEFGDTLNLDVSETLFNAVRRGGAKVPVEIQYKDLMVHQCEYHSSCATVVLLDCSHSMILYGEDRFTPAKRVAMALSHLIRTQYPGDTLNLVLFHDSAEEVPISELARVQVGPFYTNTREGLRIAQRILLRQRKDMRQIVMITDGKPSALTLEDGRIYKNAFGLDPFVVGETLEEVNKCKRAGIMINTFMLATDYSLVNFVQKITQMCKGKAYFTTPYNLGQYLLMDYMSRKTRTIH